MEEVISNIQNPAWWFTGVFFILVGLLISWIIKIWLPSVITSLAHKSRFLAKGFFRMILLRYKKRIKNLRFDDLLITREIIKNYTFLTMFFMSFLIFASTLTGLSIDYELNKTVMKPDAKDEFWLLISIVALPTYILEIAYVMQNYFIKQLIKYRRKIV